MTAGRATVRAQGETNLEGPAGPRDRRNCDHQRHHQRHDESNAAEPRHGKYAPDAPKASRAEPTKRQLRQPGPNLPAYKARYTTRRHVRMSQEQRLADEQDHRRHRGKPNAGLTRITARDAPMLIEAQTEQKDRCTNCPGQKRARLEFGQGPGIGSNGAMQQRHHAGLRQHHCPGHQMMVAAIKQHGKQQALPQSRSSAVAAIAERATSGCAAGTRAMAAAKLPCGDGQKFRLRR